MKSIQFLKFALLLPIAACVQKPADTQEAVTVNIGKGVKASVYTTAKDTELRLSETGPVTFTEAVQPLEVETFVVVNPKKTFQSILGIGSALTDASAEVFALMSEKQQDEFMKAFFDKEEGIGFSIARTNIASCDFSSASYNYVEEGDKELKTFSVEHDKQFRIPFIKKAIEYAGGNLPLMASPWSPPAFMKSNKNVLEGGSLLPEYYQAWANYYVKYIKAYESEGIPVFSISVQNEPMAVQRWESCIYTAEEERDFLKNFLGPTMEKAGLGEKKIVVWDHNRDLLSQRANVIFEDPEASKYAWGIGIHWYETWTGGQEMFDNVANVRESYPDKHIIFTEGCNEKFDYAKLHHWQNAERYGRNMINDFNNGLAAFIDWNILLNEYGGPNHVGNFCFAPAHYDSQKKETIFTPTYYYMGHFSKFVRPNAKRVSTTVSRSSLLGTSFVNPDGTMATIVMNSSASPVSYKLIVGGYMAELQMGPNAMQTIIY
ncbi:MAG: glycoside hydrolase family 30 protein [Bacteroidales bacterium]|nr:glycoside hydrolase family 30 protein [Bacteroidales bacterium]